MVLIADGAGRYISSGVIQISVTNLAIIVLMMLWSQGQEPDALIFDELFADDTQPQKHWLH